MTGQFDFSNAEWGDIAVLPVLVGYAVAKAEDSGFLGSLREIRTLVDSITKAQPAGAASELIKGAAGVDAKHKIDELGDFDADLLADIAIRACDEVSMILKSKARPDETADYQAWVFGIANGVANAAKEQGVRVSKGEASLLRRLENALDQQH